MKIKIEFYISTLSELHMLKVKFFNAIYSYLIKLEDRLFHRLNMVGWKVAYNITHRCGSLINSHYPLYGNSHPWLWKKRNQNYSCTICGETIKKSKGLSNNSARYYYLAKRGREADMEQLDRSLRTATNETEKLAVRKSMHKINSESKEIRSMREALVQATRDNNHPRIKDIHETIAGQSKYQSHD